MAKTESIEALLNPSLRVSRPVAACARCRSAKIKCDGKLPACSACERAGKSSECSSANDEFAKGKERSYVAALETTIGRLQKRIKEAKARTELDQHFSLIRSATSFNGRPALQRRPLSGTQRKEASDVDELVSDFGFLTVNATSRDFHGFTSNMSFARLLNALAVRKPLSDEVELSMPSQHAIRPLVEHYFTNIYVLLPFFSETDFRSSLIKVYQEPTSLTPIVPIDHWYIRLVLAISAASLSKAHGDAHYQTAIQHISAAMKLIELVIHPGSVAGIQALLLLVQYSMVDPEHFDSWYLIGMASRLVVDLGLHCEPAPETRLSRQTLDLRRRVFYCTYALDRRISMALGFPFSFTDDSAPNVLLPTLTTDLEKRSPTQLFTPSIRPSLFLFDIRRVQSAFYQATRFSLRKEWSASYANEYIGSMLGDVHAWHASIPPSFSARHVQFFLLEYLYSQLLAISPNQNVPLSSMTDVNKAMVFHLATQFADQMQNMVQSVESQAWMTYPDICRTKYVGRQFQQVLWSNFDHLLRHQHTIAAGQPVPSITPVDNCTRAIAFIAKVTAILDFAHVRWGMQGLRERFEQESAVLLARLQNKQQTLSKEGFSVGATSFSDTIHGSSTFASGMDAGLSYDPMQLSDGSMRAASQLPTFASPSSAQHRSNLLRAPWTAEGPQPSDYPAGTLPRRSYEFTGAGGSL